MRNVIICHYRVGKTDGVSLEIAKRVAVLAESGWHVRLLAGSGSEGADFIIPELDFDRPEVRKITKNAFHTLNDYGEEAELMSEIIGIADIIASKLSAVFEEIQPDFLLIHNIFSHGRHIAGALAFHTVLKSAGIPAMATHHDFYWEREEFNTPSCPVIADFLQKFVPPRLPNLKHAVISKRAAEIFRSRTSIDAVVIPDTLDFSMSPWIPDAYNADFLQAFSLTENDILILQATRIVARKGIELILPILEQLNSRDYLDRLKGRTIYNGKQITGASRFVFILAGYAEKEAQPYLNDILIRLHDKKIPYRYIHPGIGAERDNSGHIKRYSLFDTYVYADLVSYPSLFEGWGNQFIEAVFAKKPVMVFEYPVFISDIKPCGYHVISLGSTTVRDPLSGDMCLPDETVDRTCEQVIETLLSPETPARLETNFVIGKAHNSKEQLRKLMKENMVCA